MKSNLIIMGVCGTGKSTLGKALAKSLGVRFIDGDDLHPQANIDKMRAGKPLDDADRLPWFDSVVQQLDTQSPCIIACSALKRVYRQRLRESKTPLQFIFLDGPSDLIKQRLSNRDEHFMQASMLLSQLDTLEKPCDERDVITVSIAQSIAQQLEQIKPFIA